MSGTIADIFRKPKKIEELITDFSSNFDASGTRTQGMLEKGEAALAAQNCNCHAAQFAE